MKLFRWALYAVIIFPLAIGCVSQKKYDELAANKNRLDRELRDLRGVQDELAQMKDQYEALTTDLRTKSNQYQGLREEYSALEKANEDLLAQYNQALDRNSEILNMSAQDKAALSEELAAREQELAEKERQLALLESDMNKKRAELETARFDLAMTEKDLAEREKKINELNDQLNAQDMVMTKLRNTINEALLGFSANDLSVRQENGKVYVSLSQNLLFAKGSDVIDAKGKDAIQRLAVVLKANPDIDITVEGHTDSDGSPSLNWDLSTERATAVVKIIMNAGVNPTRLTASGRALYAPVAPNDTEANKSLNRRTEIVLSPKLDELYKLINQ